MAKGLDAGEELRREGKPAGWVGLGWFGFSSSPVRGNRSRNFHFGLQVKKNNLFWSRVCVLQRLDLVVIVFMSY